MIKVHPTAAIAGSEGAAPSRTATIASPLEENFNFE